MALSVFFHKVADCDEWRKVYDSVAELQTAGGVSQQSVHRLADDPNAVLVLHNFGSVDEAPASRHPPGLVHARQALVPPVPGGSQLTDT